MALSIASVSIPLGTYVAMASPPGMMTRTLTTSVAQVSSCTDSHFCGSPTACSCTMNARTSTEISIDEALARPHQSPVSTQITTIAPKTTKPNDIDNRLFIERCRGLMMFMDKKVAFQVTVAVCNQRANHGATSWATIPSLILYNRNPGMGSEMLSPAATKAPSNGR